ncbi:drug/metabolite transporter (DMT)-like permease [Nonlabens dokdonensis]|jgi:drug/metabolite transporter (DMT)-like permease|uniref:Drug/metabolite transporter (DMT)-like permease n=2 Tax=Nonlabens dokdonensis TaxID=328515 RepID=A0ABX5PUQ0_9FLAO|nr:EamA family transporter [Nonlabens dokdonensis]AGC78342.1 putative transmembrane protein [Nonlabens dokdonensis DSW-6]PZX37773.1 drug/metabolite transporter (DMT)-like permease [Nonlabens dokdonensis]
MNRKTILIILAFFATYVFWGSTFLWNKMAVQELPPLMMPSVRFASAGTIIFIMARLLGYSLRVTRKQLFNSIIVGFLFLAYGNGVMVWALKYVDTGFAALLAALQPLFILLLMRLVQRKALQWKSVVGVVLGLTGMYILVSQKEITTQENMVLGIIMILTCILSWSTGSLYVAKADVPKNFFVSTGYQMLTASLLLALGSSLFGEEWKSPLNWSSSTYIAMICLIIFGGIAAFTAFNFLLKNISTEKVATSSYVNPVIALLLGWYFLDEEVTTQSIIAAAVMLTGVYFINSRKRDKNDMKPALKPR